MNGFTVFVSGKPQTKGSSRAFARVLKTGKAIANIVNDNKKAAGWEALIRDTIRLEGCCEGRDLEAPCDVQIRLSFQRPQSHYRSGANARLLKASAPPCMTNKPDIDKCLRSILDALTGVAYIDDKQVRYASVFKRYADRGEPEGAEITVEYFTIPTEASA